ncbi:periplasmic oligopeptide-binding lipoprotein oppA [Mycobacterium sp. PO1]|uniref:ABC transporter family substrate-binding protein n=2 Tax=Mycobacteriaceae TaxID=1762 RepID=A0ACC6MD39_MYCPF|nr:MULTISPECIES: ABC transporter family substrate-binding protein [Mycobacteriaceae]MBX7456180.1 ABC transporter family substrate-binding protein [Mycolicibacterium aurantiacum]MCG7582080.1 ABC transporter family substrate-binding protein [Mycolicibacterium sp. OfavD-34-C]MDZ5084808.1 ABC transporter family substrate-binding protein [Mycolicibacterium parafortuitum]GFM18605.1 periplasmic oligopeptide-binding lipoprotein oppA [Mycobacterium sp. PO1]GFM26509.1 periplasmic oligopeptide-binding li
MTAWVRFLAVVATLGLVVTGCSSPDEAPSAGGDAELGASADINPQDPATLQQGGNLRLALSGFPPNFNYLHIDGNVADFGGLLRWTLPRAFFIKPDGEMTVNSDYFTSVELTSTDPQVVTYTINPKAVWTDGTPITWEDFAAQINATSGKDDRFLFAAPNGSERVESVTKGVDDRQAVITFAQHYADWRGMFAGNSMLAPKSMTQDPEAFNRGFLNGPAPSAGPFMITSVDRAAQRITLTRNPDWWGETPVLDAVTYTVLDDAAKMPALQNNALDAVGVANLDDLTIARRTQGVSIRRAPAPSWYHMTFNGAEGSILADPALRTAISKGIDRQAIASVTQRGLVDNPVPLNNHIYLAGQEGYQDNSIGFDPEAAKRDLDALGWQVNGQFREKDGRRLTIRDVFYDAQSTRQIAQIAQNNLAQIGVELQLNAVGGGQLFTDFVTPGNFDIAQFSWVGDAFALAGLTQIYASGGESNFGKIGSPEIDAQIEETLSELDPAKARELANELDKMIWSEGFSLPLFQSPGNVAVRSTLANFGPTGIGDLNYTAVGFMKP